MFQELAALVSQYGLLIIFALVLLEQLGLLCRPCPPSSLPVRWPPVAAPR